jgi:AraC family transcriptional activator of pobA
MKKIRPDRIPTYCIGDYGESVKSHEFDFARLERRLEVLPYPHRHDFYHIVWVTHGDGNHIIDSVSYMVKSNVIFFLAPRQIHDLDLPKDTTGYTINFSPEFFFLDPANRNLSNRSVFYGANEPVQALYLTDEQAHSLENIIKEIENEYHSEFANRYEIIRAYLYIFLTHAERYACKAKKALISPHSFALTQKFKALLETEHVSIGSVQRYAKKLHITQQHLSEATKIATGLSATQLMHQHLVLEAKRMLGHSNSNVTWIATQLGFDDPGYFSRFFKKHVGQTPREFQKNLRPPDQSAQNI